MKKLNLAAWISIAGFLVAIIGVYFLSKSEQKPDNHAPDHMAKMRAAKKAKAESESEEYQEDEAIDQEKQETEENTKK
jgi:hypothetical protein